MDPEKVDHGNKSEKSDEYKIAENRGYLPHPTNDIETLAHLLKGCLGSGILAMPAAFAHCGLGFGVISTAVVCFICAHCIFLLIKCAHEIYKRDHVPALSYADVVEHTFITGPKFLIRWAKWARILVESFLIIDLLGCCIIYTSLIAASLKRVIDRHTASHNWLSRRVYIVMLLPPLLILNLIRHLKYLAPFSMFANLCVGGAMCVTMYFLLSPIPPLSSQPFFVSIDKLPVFFGTCIFALECIGVVMSLENNMSDPKHFNTIPGVLCIGMTTVGALYTIVGFFGYLKYGQDTKGSITLNIPQESVVAQSVNIMITLAMFITYSLQFYVPMEIIMKYINRKYGQIKEYKIHLLRSSVIILCTVIAYAVPNIGGVISLVGAVCLSFLGLIFPAVLDMIVFRNQKTYLRTGKNLFLMCFGIVGFFTGTYVSITEIVADLKYLHLLPSSSNVTSG